MRRAAVFLDRDDTLIVNVPYLGDPDQVRLLEGVREGLWRLKAAGFALVVITNQSGVGRGLITPAQVDAVNARMVELLGEGLLDGIYNCFGTPDADPEGCRKPSPKLIFKAAEDLELDLGRSYFIGDRACDMECGRNGGVRCVLVLTGQHDDEEIRRARRYADDVVSRLSEAVDIILSRSWRGRGGATTEG
jgi:D-glycero-D-manno-heptose 1,7-bisphosphate phosphatase